MSSREEGACGIAYVSHAEKKSEDSAILSLRRLRHSCRTAAVSTVSASMCGGATCSGHLKPLLCPLAQLVKGFTRLESDTLGSDRERRRDLVRPVR